MSRRHCRVPKSSYGYFRHCEQTSLAFGNLFFGANLLTASISVVIQHVGMYCLSGLEHEMAIIMHNLIVTVCLPDLLRCDDRDD